MSQPDAPGATHAAAADPITCGCGRRFHDPDAWDLHRDQDTAGHTAGRIPGDRPLWGP